MHLLCEADDRLTLARGMQGLVIRMARGLNRKLGRTGRVLQHRYHARQLRTPREVRRALVYVMRNHIHHGGGGADIDDRSSAPWFSGWAQPIRDMRILADAGPKATADPTTWLLDRGWCDRGGGRIRWNERPRAC